MIVLDANILLRAVLGRRVRQLIDTYAGRGVRFFAPDVAFDDAEKYLPPLLKKRAKPHADFRHRSNTCETSSRRLLPNFTPSLKAKPGSDCAVETKVIGQFSPQHSTGKCSVDRRYGFLRHRSRGVDHKSNRDFSQGTSTVACISG
jgi:hypothetical protein